MPKQREPYYFTRKETTERIQEAKVFVCGRERAALRLSFPYSIAFVPVGYDPRLEESYYCAPPLSDQWRNSLSKRIAYANWSLQADSDFERIDVSAFVKSLPDRRAPVGCAVDLLFYKWVRHDLRGNAEDSPTRFATLWLGTWHHCPLLFWRNNDVTIKSEALVKVDRLPRYLDLI